MGFDVFVTFGVAAFAGFGARFVADFGGAFVVRSGAAVALVGTAGAGRSVTIPSARGPGGAATSCTRYIGGRTGGAAALRNTMTPITRTCRIADDTIGSFRDAGAGRTAVTSIRP